MPLPKPKENEEKKEFISRCMIYQDKEGKYDLENDKDRKQAVAICYTQWDRKTEDIVKIKSMSDILNEVL